MQINSYSSSPLINAIKRGEVATVKCLLRKGESPNSLKKSEETPLQVAARYGSLEIVQDLLKAGANVDQGYNYTPIGEAVMNGHLNIVRELITAGANVNACLDEDENNVLLEAVSSGNLEIVKVLVEAGANVNFKGEAGTPLLEAIESGYQNIYKFLKLFVTNEIILQQADELARTRFKITEKRKRRRENILVENFVEAASEGDLHKVKWAINQKVGNCSTQRE